MLSFESNNKGNIIQIYCDKNGIESLISELERLKSDERVGHIHLRAPSAGGHILSDKNPWGNNSISEVIISLG